MTEYRFDSVIKILLTAENQIMLFKMLILALFLPLGAAASLAVRLLRPCMSVNHIWHISALGALRHTSYTIYHTYAVIV